MNSLYSSQYSNSNSLLQHCMTISLYANSLWKDRQVLCVLYGHSLVDVRFDEILTLHLQSKKQISIENTLAIIKEISLLPQIPTYIDIAELVSVQGEERSIIKENLVCHLWRMQLMQKENPTQVILFGFGRIGRMLARELCTDLALSSQLNLKAVVTRDPVNPHYLRKRASLLMKDSIHGSLRANIVIEEESNSLIINGKTVQFISASSPGEVDYSIYGIKNAVLIDNTGLYRTQDQLKKHLHPLVIEKIIVTAPAKDVPNIVFGINDRIVDDGGYDVFSTASCTTNAITPVLDLIDRSFGIEKGHIETIHAYTNDQNLVDNMHSKSRRGRAAALNMVITETGAGKAVALALPQLAGKLTSNAIRVPIPNGSLAVLMLELRQDVNLEMVIKMFESVNDKPEKHKQIALSYDEDLVSSDIIGNPASGIVDMSSIKISKDGKTLTLYVWYDNEYGYCMQVLGFASLLAKKLHQSSQKSIEVSDELLLQTSI